MSHERVSLEVLEQGEGFARRHIGPSKTDKQAMIKALGLASMDDLVERVVPSGIMSQAPLSLEKGRTEQQALADLRTIAAKNKVQTMIGMGYYNCHTPSVILRNVRKPCLVHRVHAVSARISQGRPRRSSISRPWSPISPGWRSRMPRYSTRARRRPKPWAYA